MNIVADAEHHVHGEIDQLLSACTRCGKCVDVCPVVPYGAASGADSRAVVADVLQLLGENRASGAAASAWMHGCNGCGDCIEACPEGVNPRKMLMLANMRDAAIESRTPQLFRRMARSIKLMIAMQLLPQDYARLFTPSRPRKTDLVFYTGCNALRTPNLMFNTLYILDALELDYEVVGGPSSCCGVIASKWEGELPVGGRVTAHTLKRFGDFEAEKVLNWCPTCDLHLNETMAGFRPRGYDFDHVTAYLLERADELRRRFVRGIPRRVVLHAHHGMPEVGRNVEALLRSIPDLQVVETVLESSYTCGGSGCSRSPQLQAVEHAHLLDRVRATRADALVTLYHGCHMAFIGHEKPGGFEVVNFTDLLAEALGQPPRPDRLKQLRHLEDWKLIVREAQPWLLRNGVRVDSDWLERYGAEIFSVAEFRGGLDCLASEAPPGRTPDAIQNPSIPKGSA
ncbi:(Fe-S)-binding protein [Ramlibacter tataouinensis]|uniref:(Fe-S)-binding protein n=1 Tax=Ramlibacter tataouinensis TaxID=94132 RepID=UPI0022F39FD5|nr:(Fe-S)-binding protein [Ramlibacter tataouinensis]WBX99918.1 (Fe-S)-binding protein [Ramlibacter tataouinensis]